MTLLVAIKLWWFKYYSLTSESQMQKGCPYHGRTRHYPPFPLITQAIADTLIRIMNEPSLPLLWKAGRIAGWMEALIENSP